MKTPPNRLCIYPKDIQRITGKSERYSRTLMHKIKNHLKKPDHHLITFQDFCTYTGIPIENITEFMKS